jgi:hypothetical protein
MQWANTPFSEEQFETGNFPALDATKDESALVVNAMAINLYKDDVVSLTMTVPGQQPVVSRVVLERNRAVQRLYAGKKRSGDWPRGRYAGRFEILRGNVVMFSKDISFAIK